MRGSKSHNAMTCKEKMKLRGVSKTLVNVLKVDLCILTTMEMSYAKGQNTVKYHQCIDKTFGGITTWKCRVYRLKFDV